MENNTTIQEIAAFLEEWDDLLVLTHANPDADTLGSAFAIKYAYPEKNIDIANADPIPKRLDFITKGSTCELYDKEYAHVISVDCAELHLMGTAGKKYSDRIELKIDHHRTSTEFAAYNYADDTAAACGEIIYDILKQNNRISYDAAEALYAAIASDTGCFRFRNVSQKTHNTAAELIRAGIDFGTINTLLFENRSKAEISAMRVALNSLEYFFDGLAAVIGFSNDIKTANGIDDDALGSVNSLPREIEGVELGIVIKEKSEKPGEYKVSMRSGVSIDCSEICGMLGGGGHIRASGASVRADSLEEAKRIILEKVTKCIK